MFNHMLSNIKRLVFRPLKTIASALWHLLLSTTAFAIPPFGFSSLPSGVYYSSFMVYSPSGVCYFVFRGLPPHPMFAVPSSGICYSAFGVAACFSPFVVIRSKIPPPTPMSDRQKDVFLTQSNHKKSKRSKTACFLLL